MTHFPFGRQIHLGLIKFLVLASMTGAGCSTGSQPPPSSATPVTSTLNQLCDQLLAENSLTALAELLSANSSGPPPKAMGCLHAWRSQKIDDVRSAGILNRTTKISSGSASFVVVPGTTKPDEPDPHQLNPMADVVFVFEPTGKYVGKVGGEFAPDKLNGDNVLITDLGSKKDWFAVVTRFEKSGDFEQYTRVYQIADSLPLLVTFRHQPNDFDLPLFRGPNTIPFERPFIRFKGREKTLSPPNLGVDQEGQAAVPELVWREEAARFEGPISLTYKDIPVFQVAVDASPHFSQHSTRQWSKQMLAVLEKVRDSQPKKED